MVNNIEILQPSKEVKDFLGQNRLVSKLSLLSVTNMPRTLILLGDKGSGKHLFTRLIINKLGVQAVKLNSIDQENLLLIEELNTPTIVLIEQTILNVKNQFKILKFIEEPNPNLIVILLCEHKNLLLRTILNRGQIWEFVPYTEDVLSKFTDNKKLLNYFITPGQCLEASEAVDIEEMETLAEKIFIDLSRASVTNILTIPQKTCELELFNRILLKTASSLYQQKKIVLNQYLRTQEYAFSYMQSKDTKLFENYLLKLYTEVTT